MRNRASLRRYPEEATVFRLSLLAGTMGAMVAISAPSRACTICVGMPEKSVADYLIESHCVILAREDPSQPFAFAPVEVLKGEFDGDEIDLLVDSLTRRRLNADEQRKVLLVQQHEQDQWRSLGIASATFEQLARRILAHAPEWQTEKGRAKRIEFFLSLFGHKDPQTYRLAYLEIGRAPYGVIRQLGQLVPRVKFGTMLEDRRYIEWRPLAILLLAQSPTPEDAQYARESLESAHRLRSTTNLAAWAAAVIEIDGVEAVAYLERHYCQQSDRTPEELRAVFQAFSLHGTEDTGEIRDRIVAAYRVLRETHPTMGDLVTRDLRAWNPKDLVDRLQPTEAARAASELAGLPAESVVGNPGE